MEAVQQSQAADLLQIMAKDKNKDVRGAVAKNPYTPSETLYELSEQEDIQRYLIINPALPEDLLRSILDKTPKLVGHLPMKSHVPLWALELHWQQDELYNAMVLQDLLLSHAETNYQIQKEAFFDFNRYHDSITDLLKIIALLHNEKPDYYLLRERAKLSWWEKIAYLLNPNVPEEATIRFVAQDPNRYVRAAAREKLANLPRL
jgi:hypothetical protein